MPLSSYHMYIDLPDLQQEFDKMKQLGLPTMFINFYDDMEKVGVSQGLYVCSTPSACRRRRMGRRADRNATLVIPKEADQNLHSIMTGKRRDLLTKAAGVKMKPHMV